MITRQLPRVLLTFLLLMSTTGWSATIPGLTVTGSGGDLVMTYRTPPINTSAVQMGGRSFVAVTFEGSGVQLQPGRPALPLKTVLVPVSGPAVTQPEVDVSAVDTRLVKGLVAPAQRPWPKNRLLQDRPLDFDPRAYETEGPQADWVTVGQPVTIGGVRVLPVTMRPVRYNPLNHALTIATEIRVRIPGVRMASVDGSRPMGRWLKQVVADAPEPARLSAKSKTLDTGVMGRYLIITAPEFEEGLAALVTHKEDMGYAVTVRTTSETGTTTSSIRDAIEKAYDDPATRPDFVILVGDENHIPAWQGAAVDNANETLYTDLFYATLDGDDHFPDVFIGRFPVRDTGELAHMVAKTIWMEDRAATTDREGLFVASDDNHEVSETTHDFVKSVLLSPDGWSWTDVYMHEGGQPEDVTTAFESGTKLAVYSGHGAYEAWWRNVPSSSPFFGSHDGGATYLDLNTLSNTEYPYVFTFACITGAFVQGAYAGGSGGAPAVCLSEAWVTGEHGGVTSWASSVNSYWDQDDVLERAVFRAMVDDGIHRVGPMFVAGLTAMWTHYAGDDYSRAYFEQYNLMGDPGLFTDDYAVPVSEGRIFASADRMAGSDTVTVEVWDSDLIDGWIEIEAVSPLDGSAVTRVIYKYASGKYSGEFSGTGLVPGLDHTGTIILRYADAARGTKGPATVETAVTVDMDPPSLVHVAVSGLTLTDATMDLTFSEVSDWSMTVRADGGATVLETGGTGADRVQVNCSGLTPDTAYVMDLVLTDAFGHGTTVEHVQAFQTPTGTLPVNAPCDSDDGTFTHTDVSDLWQIVSDGNAHSGGACWFGLDWDHAADSSLVLPDVALPMADRVVLSFWHRYALESGYDGGVLEISTDGGQSWSDLGAQIPAGEGGYTGVISAQYGSPIPGRKAWTGSLDTMSRVAVDLTGWAGQTVWIRFRLGCDSSEAWDGWWIDDVQVAGIDAGGTVLTFVGLTPYTVLSLVTGDDAVTVVLNPFRTDGEPLPAVQLPMAGHTGYHQTVADLLAPTDATDVAAIRVTADGRLAGWQLRDTDDERGAMRLWTPAFTGGERAAVVVPHVANTTWYWTTGISVFNGTDNPSDVWFCYTPGALMEPGVAVPLAPRETASLDVESELFGGYFPQTGVSFGALSGPAGSGLAPLAAVETFEKRSIANGASLTLDLAAGTRLVVAHVAENTAYWWTGIALDNLSSNRTAAVSVTGYQSDGTITASRLYGIRPGNKLLFVAADEFPDGTAWLDVQCDEPMIGYELFGTHNNMLLAGLGIPPAPAGATDLLLPAVDLEADWLGLTVVNPEDVDVSVTLTYYAAGIQVGEQVVTLQARRKLVGLVGNPEGTTGNYLFEGNCDAIRVRSDRPVVAFCLEGDKDMTRLGGVMAARPQ